MGPEISQTVTFLQTFIIPPDIYKQVVVLRRRVISKHLSLQRMATCSTAPRQVSVQSSRLSAPRRPSPPSAPHRVTSVPPPRCRWRDAGCVGAGGDPVRSLILFSWSELSPRTNINIMFILTKAKLYKTIKELKGRLFLR